MDKLTVSKSSIWYKIARFGGFNESYYWRHDNSCAFVSKLFWGCLFMFIIALISIGMLVDIGLFLIWLGLPQVTAGWINGSIMVQVVMFQGFIGISGCVIVSAAFALNFFIVPGIFAFNRFLGSLIPDTRKTMAPIKDYLAGICKPLDIVD